MNQEIQQKNELQMLVLFMKKYRRPLFLVTLLCALLAGIISFLIPKEYESSAVVFPPANLSLDMSSENPNFGYDIEADRLLQILQSKEIRDSVISKFDLAKYYDINPKDQDWMSKIDRKYRKDVDFKRSTFMSIIITCQTRDPELSANMVNYILKIADRVRENIYKQNVKLAHYKLMDEFHSEKRITDSLYDLLQAEFKSSGISGLVLLAPSAQLNLNMDQLHSGKNGETSNAAIGADILKYRFHLDRQNDFDVKLRHIEKMLEYPIAKIHVLDSAEPNYKKTYPLVTLNILASALFGFLLSSLYFILKPRA